eukprot:511009-Pleurochrysis_carterae.AAC.1
MVRAPQVLRTREHPMGVPQSDGGLSATVTRANAIIVNCVRVANAAHMRGGNFVFESPVSRGADSPFAIEGTSKHVDMSTHNDLARLAATAGVGRIFFDQYVFGAPTPRQHKLSPKSNYWRTYSHDSARGFAGTLQARTILSSARLPTARPSALKRFSITQPK